MKNKRIKKAKISKDKKTDIKNVSAAIAAWVFIFGGR